MDSDLSSEIVQYFDWESGSFFERQTEKENKMDSYMVASFLRGFSKDLLEEHKANLKRNIEAINKVSIKNLEMKVGWVKYFTEYSKLISNFEEFVHTVQLMKSEEPVKPQNKFNPIPREE